MYFGENLGDKISPFKIEAKLWSQMVSAYLCKVNRQSTEGYTEGSGL